MVLSVGPNPPHPERRSDRIYQELSRRIASGELVRGDRLPSESALAEAYGVSRPTIREALARLREDGVVRSRRGAGAFVEAPIDRIARIAPLASLADLERCFDYRIALEGGAARRAARNRDPGDLARLRAAYDAMDAINREKRTGQEEDFAFHLALALASKNRFFVAGLEQVRAHIAQGMTINRTLSLEAAAPRLTLVQAEHARIVAAVEASDEEAAAAALARHLEGAWSRMLQG